MAGRTFVFLAGTGHYMHWGHLAEVHRDLARFADYALCFPSPTIIHGGTLGTLTAPAIRQAVPEWLNQADEADDVVLVWSGHGVRTDQHYLVTYETPGSGDMDHISTSNAIATSEFTAWIRGCRAMNIVIIVDTCWAGPGGADLAGRLAEASNDASPDERSERSCEIIVSARNEVATDRAFMDALLRAVHTNAPQSEAWPRGTERLSVDQLVNELNVSLEGQQAEPRRGYGTLGAFFPRVRVHDPRRQLPEHAREEIETAFSEELADTPILTWNVESLQGEALWRTMSPHLSERLHCAAVALSAMDLMLSWVGQTRLQGRYEQAWREEFPDRGDQPDRLFDYFDYVARHRPTDYRGSDHRGVVRFMARLLLALDEDPYDDRLYSWAGGNRIDMVVVDQMIKLAEEHREPARLLIDLAEGCEYGDLADRARSAVGTVLEGRRPVGERVEFTIDEVGADPEAAITAVFEHARRSASSTGGSALFRSVDVILPASELAHIDPMRIKVPVADGLPVEQEIGRSHMVVTHSGDRLYRSGYPGRHEGGKGLGPLNWIVPAEDWHALLEQTRNLGPSIGLRRLPPDVESWAVLLIGALQLVWHRSDQFQPQHAVDANAAWSEFPGCVVKCFRESEGLVIHELGVVWDDDEWLALFDELTTHRASF